MNITNTIGKRVAKRLSQVTPEDSMREQAENAFADEPDNYLEHVHGNDSAMQELLKEASYLDAEEFQQLVEGLARVADETAQVTPDPFWHEAAKFLHQAAHAISKRSGN